MPPQDSHAEFDYSFLLFSYYFLPPYHFQHYFNDWVNPLPFPLKGEILQVLAHGFHIFMLNT